MKHLKIFNELSEYQSYIDISTDSILAYCRDNFHTHINKRSNIIKYKASEKLEETTTDISSGLHTNKFDSEIKSHTFSHGNGIIKFKDIVTTIDDYAFNNCSTLSYVNIPKSVTSIGDYAFKNCYNYDKLEILNSSIEYGEYPFSGCNNFIDTIQTDTFFNRTTANGSTLLNDKVIVNNIKGNTYVWRQKWNNSSATLSSSGITASLTTTAETITITITPDNAATTSAYAGVYIYGLSTISHKYYYSADIYINSDTTQSYARFGWDLYHQLL